MATTTELTLETLLARIESLEKTVKKQQRTINKLLKHVVIPESDAPKKQSGFAQPKPISGELAEFLGVPKDTIIARTEVTKLVTKYVKEHNLQNPENKRELVLDDKLTKLLKPQDGEKITFFTLQRFMAPHYPKVDKPAAAKEERPKTAPAAVEEKQAGVKKVVKKVAKK